jgi:hypothetical protein
MQRYGDKFTGGGNQSRNTVVDPNAPRWSDQIIYFFRVLLGEDGVDKVRAVVWTYNAAIGALIDPTADLAALGANPATALSTIALLKASALRLVAINTVLDNIETAVGAIGVKVDATNAALAAANITLDEIATQSAAIGVTVADVLTTLQQFATASVDEGIGPRTLNGSGRVAWVRWEMDPTAPLPRMELSIDGTVVQASNRDIGGFTFEPALPIGAYSISVNPGGAVNAIVNAGVIL